MTALDIIGVALLLIGWLVFVRATLSLPRDQQGWWIVFAGAMFLAGLAVGIGAGWGE